MDLKLFDSDFELLLSYLSNVIHDSKKIDLDFEKLHPDFHDFGKELKFFCDCIMGVNELALALSKGELTNTLPPRGNKLAAPLKSLHASLRHLTWQAEQIAKGDYLQRIDFMGDFSRSFNTMVEQLADRQQKLEDKIEQAKKQKASIEQNNLMLSALMHNIPQQIIVIDKTTRNVLLTNNIVMDEVNKDPGYVENILKLMVDSNGIGSISEKDISYIKDGVERNLHVKTYSFEWPENIAEVFAIIDVTASISKTRALETHAYHDSITKLYNRYFYVLTLDSWVLQKKQFVLVFIDLDNLKHVNDEFGHSEGDIYIQNAAKHLKTFSDSVVACRIGGDEFALLTQGISYDQANIAMLRIYSALQNDEHLKDKTYEYSLSYGIVYVDEDNKMTPSNILSVADERMYLDKRKRKEKRKAERENLAGTL